MATTTQKNRVMQVLGEDITLFNIPLRESLRKQLARRALETGTSMRGFVLNALKAQGLDILDEEVVDRRRLREEKVA